MTKRQRLAVRLYNLGILTSKQFDKLWNYEVNKSKMSKISTKTYMSLKNTLCK